jgi:rhamnulokinase
VNRLRAELCPEKSFTEIVSEAEASEFTETLDANAPDLLSPASIREAFDAALGKKPQTPGDYFSCAYRSLALSYKNAIEELEHNTGRKYKSIYIVGGGARNAFLNDLTEKETGMKVIALPIEATAIGNLKVQMEAAKC